jgi:2-polyprenyl-3-methyl-5-hydroxy-6-metoxy-1,4-benzoquinol methylase
MLCPACDRQMSPAGTAAYYTRTQKFRTPVEWCRACDIYGRTAEASELVDHYYAASYVQPENEARFKEQRIGFFTHLVGMFRSTSAQRQLLDFGSSYGHLMEIAKERGFDVCGVELNQDLVAECNRRGLPTVSAVPDAPGTYNCVAMIDSLYCLPNPIEVLGEVVSKLSPNGELLIRITNRNAYARIMNRLKRQTDFSTIGDATFSYSQGGARKLLARAGLRITEVTPDYGIGKTGLGRKTMLYYGVCKALGKVSGGRVQLAPGLIVRAVAG